jgi:hypothetical protein
LLLGGGVVWSYWPVLRETAGKWFNNPQYSHAYLVPLFSAYLLWRSRESFKHPLALGMLWVELRVLSFLLVDAGGEEPSPADFTGQGPTGLEPAQG